MHNNDAHAVNFFARSSFHFAQKLNRNLTKVYHKGTSCHSKIINIRNKSLLRSYESKYELGLFR